VEYWDRQETSIDGVLGGYGGVHGKDMETSSRIVDRYIDTIGQGRGNEVLRALDCGAGIGRVAKHLLMPRVGQVDLIEPSKAPLDKAREDLEATGKLGR
jgi:protein N-terminal methyltransferase